ncbi:serine hydrolase domain-containing protein [Clostridium intestinale]|uniref:CubicO group peptidase, beta-lactamase class C family n=1 Tax=Clostridium intestinale DSM 6191 TaxID=1121320 RepID=A0A1M5UIK1_9CLOT|nr:serine hydrolase [Clostridium intestinale]SHH62473.1 CubicO group peptidase, beta-lactamase class C family [Clostridium intestinale DSM 6191]
MNQRKKIEFERIISNNYNNIAGIVVQKNGKLLYENYFNKYTASNSVHIASVTKSIFSALIGIALEKKHIKSLEQKVLDFFPYYKILEGEKAIQNITIRHMLTMTAPYKYKKEPYEKFFESDNWIEAALDLLGGKEPSQEFTYSAIIGTHILSGILVKATGKSVFDFAKENLFTPLEINVKQNITLATKEEYMAFLQDKNISGWATDPQGINTAAWGLTLTPMDMAKIGQLYLDKGLWNGSEIVPKWWVDESTIKHSTWDKLSYGYLWWIIDNNEHIYAAIGDGGNVIYINEKKKLVISIASLPMEKAKDRIKLIREYIEPLFENEA